MSQKIRIKLKSFDHNLVDKSAEKIVKTVKSTGAVVSGPVPLPTQKKIFTVNRSTFVNPKIEAGLEPVGVAGAPNAGGCFPPERTQRAGLQPRGRAFRCRRHRKADAADGNN